MIREIIRKWKKRTEKSLVRHALASGCRTSCLFPYLSCFCFLMTPSLSLSLSVAPVSLLCCILFFTCNCSHPRDQGFGTSTGCCSSSLSHLRCCCSRASTMSSEESGLMQASKTQKSGYILAACAAHIGDVGDELGEGWVQTFVVNTRCRHEIILG